MKRDITDRMSSSNLPEVVGAPPAPSSVEEVIEEVVEEVVEEGDEKVLEEGDEKVVEEGDKKVLDEGDEKVVEEGDEKVLDEGDEKVVEEGDVKVLDEGDQKVLEEVVEEVEGEVVEDVIAEAAITIASNAEMCAKDESQDPRQSFKFLSAYSFLGDAAEFSKPPYHTPKKLRGLVSRFRTPSPQKFSEFPLQMFANWYAEDLPMVAALVECTNKAGITEPWHYTVVILNPSGASSGTRRTDDKFDAHCRLAVDFYHLEFKADENDYVSFSNAVMSDGL